MVSDQQMLKYTWVRCKWVLLSSPSQSSPLFIYLATHQWLLSTPPQFLALLLLPSLNILDSTFLGLQKSTKNFFFFFLFYFFIFIPCNRVSAVCVFVPRWELLNLLQWVKPGFFLAHFFDFLIFHNTLLQFIVVDVFLNYWVLMRTYVYDSSFFAIVMLIDKFLCFYILQSISFVGCCIGQCDGECILIIVSGWDVLEMIDHSLVTSAKLPMTFVACFSLFSSLLLIGASGAKMHPVEGNLFYYLLFYFNSSL